MNQDIIYFDNASTSYPKPQEVVEAVAEFLETAGSPGRGAHKVGIDGARRVFQVRMNLADYLGVRRSSTVIFTPGCTASINMVLKGLALGEYLRQGDLVLTTSIEHNAVMRPLEQLKKTHGIEVEIIDTGSLENGIWTEVSDQEFLDRLKTEVEKKTPRLVCLNWASNVTGQLLPVLEAARFLKEQEIPLLVDAAQTLGRVPVTLRDSGITFLCAAGHKGLMGPPGVGILCLPGDFSELQLGMMPLIAGGTGSSGDNQFDMPVGYPDRFEAGTQPGHSIAGLGAGLEWVQRKVELELLNNELLLAEKFSKWAREQDYLTVYGGTKFFHENGDAARLPIVSFAVKGKNAPDMAGYLDTEYGIATRAGNHCATICHNRLGTPAAGLVRVSFGPHNNADEVRILQESIAELVANPTKHWWPLGYKTGK